MRARSAGRHCPKGRVVPSAARRQLRDMEEGRLIVEPGLAEALDPRHKALASSAAACGSWRGEMSALRRILARHRS